MFRFLRSGTLLVALVALGVCRAHATAPLIGVQQDTEQAVARRLFFQPRLGDAPRPSAPKIAARREVAEQLIAEHRARLFGGEPIELEHLRTRNSLSGTQVFYRQTYRGIPVESGQFIVTMDRDARPLAIWNEAQAGLQLQNLRPSIAAGAAIAAVDRSDDANRRVPARAELAILPRDGGILVYRVEVSLWSPFVDWVAYVDAQSGAMLERYDRVVNEKAASGSYSVEPFEFPVAPSSKSASAALVTGTGLVLPVNPLNEHPERYGLRDGDDVDVYRESKSLERLDGSGFLRGAYVDVVNVFAGSRVNSPTFTYNFSSLVTNSPFHEVNAYWHVDLMQDYIKSTLGIDGANDTQQDVAVHALTDDNSMYTPGSDLISMGDGGVDDSEDGEVVVHEYGHAVHDAISGLSFDVSENRALSEGFGDYLSAILGNNPYVMEWDATAYFQSIPNPFPYLRSLVTTLRYDQKNGSWHHDGQIIGGAWWDLRQVLGAELTDQLVLEAFFHFTLNGNFKDFADATIQADLALYGGAHLVDIFQAYDGRLIPMTSLLAGDHEVPADSATADGPFPVTLTVVSTRPLAASDPVRMYFRYNGDPSWYGPVPMGPATGDDWTGNIPGPNARKRIEYSFEFENDSGQIVKLPSGAPDTFYSFAVGTSLAASGIEHAGQRDLPLEEWPPTLRATLLNATPDQQLFVRYQIGATRSGESQMLDDGQGNFAVQLPRLPLDAGTSVQYQLVAPTESGELVDGPYSFKLLAPRRVMLLQNAPNPFNPSTDISFLLPQAGRARLVVFDVAGRKVRELLNEDLAAGSHTRSWDGRDDAGRRVASGVYLYRLSTPSGVRAKRMTLAQ